MNPDAELSQPPRIAPMGLAERWAASVARAARMAREAELHALAADAEEPLESVKPTLDNPRHRLDRPSGNRRRGRQSVA